MKKGGGTRPHLWRSEHNLRARSWRSHTSRRNPPRSSTFAGRIPKFKPNKKSLNSTSRVVMMRKGSRVGAAEGGNDLPSWFKNGRPQSSVETYLRTWNKKRWLGLTWKPTWSSCTTHKTEDGPKVRQDVASDPRPTPCSSRFPPWSTQPWLPS